MGNLFRPSVVASADTDAGIAIVVLGTACTAAAFALFASLISTIGAARTSIITYVAPIVAVIAGVVVLDEEIGPGALVGLVLILTGSYLATRPSSAPAPPPPLAPALPR
ncbi:MAG: EamA family transporter [Solirubrobacteraceae bacterium]